MKLSSLSILFLFLTGLFSSNIQAQQLSATEIRAAWLTTNWNLDWPRANSSPQEQQRQLREILDQLQEANFNTVLIQVRVRGDLFYKSKLEPWSSYFQKNDVIGAPAAYDPLEFAIKECHKRGMECHAWFVTFPVGSPKLVKNRRNGSIAFRRPDICKLHLREWFLNPGHPDARAYIVSMVDELVSNYDIDGIHFDYIRYPDSATKFPDKDTYKKYGNGKSLYAWRRDNITSMVTDIYDKVKSLKPWVQVSSSPLGRYRSLDPMRGKWTAYESVQQDAARWLQDGKMDAIYPMLYYNEAEFKDYVNDWINEGNGRFVVPGLGVYRMLPTEGDWSLNDIREQINITEQSQAAGVAYYRVANVLDNTKGVFNMLKRDFYPYPAKIPAMKWLDDTAPASPLNIQVYRDVNDLITIEWESSDKKEQQTYTVYESPSDDLDPDNAQNIVMTGVHGKKIYLNRPDSETGIYISITASDRFHNESTPTSSVFFIPSKTLEK